MASRVYDDAPLVVGANRDERLDRPAVAITVLQPDEPRILGGRDEKAGGTWLAVNDRGVVAALTNLPSPGGRDDSKRTRGELPLALAQDFDARRAVEDFVSRFDPSDYNPAWFLVGDRNSLFSVEMNGHGEAIVNELGDGLHILENLPLGAPSPKVDHIRDLIGPLEMKSSDGTELFERLRTVLGDHSLPPGATDSETNRRTETLSACVHSEDYGTRSSTLVSVPAHPASPIWLSVADGPPCTAPFVDVTALWSPERS